MYILFQFVGVSYCEISIVVSFTIHNHTKNIDYTKVGKLKPPLMSSTALLGCRAQESERLVCPLQGKGSSVTDSKSIVVNHVVIYMLCMKG
jgi:hypothetical protein